MCLCKTTDKTLFWWRILELSVLVWVSLQKPEFMNKKDTFDVETFSAIHKKLFHVRGDQQVQFLWFVRWWSYVLGLLVSQSVGGVQNHLWCRLHTNILNMTCKQIKKHQRIFCFSIKCFISHFKPTHNRRFIWIPF